MSGHTAGRPRRFTGGLVVLVALALVGLATLSGCSRSQTGGLENGRYTDSSGSITIIEPEQRGEPVELSAPTLEGENFDLASLRGNVAVLNVWYSTCVPCRKEAPDLVAAYNELHPDGVNFLGLNIKQGDDAAAIAFQRAFEVPYPSLTDNGGATLLALRGNISPNVVPATLVLDDQGRVAARISGQTTKNTLIGVVEAVRTGKVYVAASSPASESVAP